MKLLKIICPVCKLFINKTDIVAIDTKKNLSHKNCYPGQDHLIIDVGTYKEIARLFPYFYQDWKTKNGNSAFYWKVDNFDVDDYLSREIKKITNDVGDEIELEIIQKADFYYVIASICQEKPPFKDFVAFGRDFHSKREAVKKALKRLYLQAYPN